jgi:hypothetical protein
MDDLERRESSRQDWAHASVITIRLCAVYLSHRDYDGGGPVVVVDTHEMLHHKRGGVLSGDNLEAARSEATTYYTCLSRDILGLLPVRAVWGLQRSARLAVAPTDVRSTSLHQNARKANHCQP